MRLALTNKEDKEDDEEDDEEEGGNEGDPPDHQLGPTLDHLYEDHGHTFELSVENNPYEDLEPLGIRYLLPPRIAPTRVLTTFKMFPFVNNGTNLEHHFQAYGVTLVTENCHRELVCFHGDATIQITEPDPGEMI